MVKTCDNNIARRNAEATLDLLSSTQKNMSCSSSDMAQKRNGDRIPKAMKTILPAIIKPTRIKAGHELLPWLIVAIDC